MPKLIRQRGGGVIEVNNDGKIEVFESFTCHHCNKVTLIPHKAKPEDVGGLCYGCFHLVCKDCAGGACVTIEQWCEQEEARGRMFRDMGLI